MIEFDGKEKNGTFSSNFALSSLQRRRPKDPSSFILKDCSFPKKKMESLGTSSVRISLMNESLPNTCLKFKEGKFLPSGNQDGLYWRPSQGVALKGSKLHKRYFYARLEDEQMIKRQVTWIADLPNYCFVEYRRNYDGDVQLSDLCGPPTLDWMSLMAHVLQFHNGLLSSPTLVLPSLTIESDPKGSDSDISSPSSSPFISPNQSEESFNRSNHTFERSLWSDFIINTSFEFI
eukprot:TRINITY_DN48_c0_g1_i2.p1 TRINITY_DN48_c0_g1~~TRINITY_DN48_c0_g1_i2.p1  ORF type:complete len:233 (+),score=72.10 TRINITY_DN48_c0_g1_i2:249-947(+)